MHPSFADPLSTVEVGQSWAHREPGVDELSQVRVLTLGNPSARTKRVKVEFLDDRYEGLQRWEPLGRLKCLWSDVASFLDWEERWERLHADGRPDSAERDAAWECFFTLAPETIHLYYNGAMGIGEIRDIDRLTQLLSWDSSVIIQSEAHWENDDVHLVRWHLTRDIAIRLAQRFPTRVAEIVRRERAELADMRREQAELMLQHTLWYSEDDAARQAEERIPDTGKAYWDVLARWIGQDEELRANEAAQLRADFDRLALLSLKAASEVRRLNTNKARRLANELEKAARRTS